MGFDIDEKCLGWVVIITRGLSVLPTKGSAGVQLDTSPIAQGYRKLFRAIRIFAFVARVALIKGGHI